MRSFILSLIMSIALCSMALDNQGIVYYKKTNDAFPLVTNSKPANILVEDGDLKGISIAATNLAADFGRVCGVDATIIKDEADAKGTPLIIAASVDSKIVSGLMDKADLSSIKGKDEMYLIKTISNPYPGVDEALLVAGSDRRGTIYGIYEISEQLGVSPWFWWADVPVEHQSDVYLMNGSYTAGEPAVRYRGIFLNDEAPCLTSWVANQFGTKYGGKEFYAKVFELILRLRGNFLWPAMWGWAFYADDPENSALADEMGIIMGTSHHEPMARNHQEWARRRGADGPWDYAKNKKVLDQFFREGIERSRDNEDLITIGMRGDGDAPMGGQEGKDHEYVSRDKENMRLLEDIIKNQRRIIKEVTGQKPEKRQQVWALYKEVQKFYELGLQVPDDVIILLSDDNWGNVRKLPNAEERKRKGGWGMYYHVDYVGAPRNTKWLNVTPIQNLWEQMSLAYEYGVDKLWVLNVGDLKPMEYPITLFLNMAWNPTKYTATNLLTHTIDFFSQQFGEGQGAEAARIFNLYSKYAGRVTPEMLDASTYTLENGEWRQVHDEWVQLEAEALRQYITLKPEYRDAYQQFILFPIQALGNLYDMYYSVAMNRYLHEKGNPDCNIWADKAQSAFERDAKLQHGYNHEIAAGKWDGMMTQKHIGYRSWNDNFPADRLPEVYRLPEATGRNIFEGDDLVAMEAEHFYQALSSPKMQWTIIPYMGRTLSGLTLMPRLNAPEDAKLTYKFKINAPTDSVDVRVVTKSTLAFANPDGHKYTVAFEGQEPVVVNFNGDLNEKSENIYSKYYPTVARRVVEKTIRLPLKRNTDGISTLTISPLDQGIVFEKIVVSAPGAYSRAYLQHPESPRRQEP